MTALDSHMGAIRREHEAAQRHAAQAVTHAIRAGELLLEVRARLQHGAFGPYLAALPFSESTARGYMRLARLPAADRQRVADLSLRAALADLRPKTAEPYTFKLEPGAAFHAMGDDGPFVFVSESEKHPGYWDIEYLDGAITDVIWSKRPVRGDLVAQFLEHLNVPKSMNWKRLKCDLKRPFMVPDSMFCTEAHA